MMVLQPRAAPWVSGVQCVHTCHSPLCSCLQEEEDTSETAVAILMMWSVSNLTYQFNDEIHFHFPTHLLLFRKASPLSYLIYFMGSNIILTRGRVGRGWLRQCLSTAVLLTSVTISRLAPEFVPADHPSCVW